MVIEPTDGWRQNSVSLNTGLIAAITQRDFAMCDWLIKQGADPNWVAESGETVLHLAVKAGDARLVALLLARDADYKRPNGDGQLPLANVGIELLHRIRQEYQRLPLDSYPVPSPDCADVSEPVRTLEKQGIVRVSGIVSAVMLRSLRKEFQAFVRRLRLQVGLRRLLRRPRNYHYDQEEYWLPRERVYTTNNAFKYSATLIDLCRSPYVAAIANQYLRKPAFVQRAQAMRYLPSGPMSTNQFQWHHDMEDKRLKLMVLLTDVAEDGQYMSYVIGSHVAYHPHERFLKNSLDLDYCRTYVPAPSVYHAIGRAGDIFFFDSNGMHRGNRSISATRDAYFIEFSADKHQNWGATIPSRLLAQVEDSATDPLHRLRHTPPKWKQLQIKGRRTVTTWALSLENLDSWV